MPHLSPTGCFSRRLARDRLLRGGWNLDRGLVPVLRHSIGGRTALDFGAGVGRYCRELGCRGIDGIPGVEELSNGWVSCGDLTDPSTEISPHEVAICLEVAEHIPREFEPTFLDHLARQCDTLVLSWAAPGQPGIGHVNCRAPAEVLRLLGERGFEKDEAATQSLRAAATIGWLKQNVTAFERNPPRFQRR